MTSLTRLADRLGQPPMLYQNAYVWLVFASAMDIMMTWVVLWYGGTEVNAVANAVLFRLGLPGMVAFKFAMVLLVILICEVVGRRRPGVGKGLARASVAITFVPVTLAFAQLLLFVE